MVELLRHRCSKYTHAPPVSLRRTVIGTPSQGSELSRATTPGAAAIDFLLSDLTTAVVISVHIYYFSSRCVDRPRMR